jgi:hypothetical protein
MKNDQNENFGLTFVETKCDYHRAIASFSKVVTFQVLHYQCTRMVAHAF